MGLQDDRRWEWQERGFGQLPEPAEAEPFGTPRRLSGPKGGGAAGAGPERLNFYADWLTAAEHADLAEAGRPDVSDEVALLRIVVRRAIELGDLRELLNVLRLLVVTLKLHAALSYRDRRAELDAALDDVLDEMSEELGQPL
jgi:hypothetical protein